MNADQWLVIYLLNCLEYIKKYHLVIYYESGADQFDKEVKEFRERINILETNHES